MKPCLCLDEVDSTNSYALRNLEDFADGSVVVARIQTRGHGRLSRRWISHRGSNLTFSLVLKPQRKPENLAAVTQYMALAIIDVLSHYGVEGTIKWPNDILVNGAKIAGILSESRFENRLMGCVLGVGVNLNMTEAELRGIDQAAASLNLLTGKKCSPEAFLERLLERFFDGYDLFLEGGFSIIRDEYMRRTAFLGREISVVSPGSSITGIATDVRKDGSLVVLNSKGEELSVTAGDVECFYKV
jgi:BirA family biotin operon repressor/biotin-[acetyl-CoA-carboxylase] ligase